MKKVGGILILLLIALIVCNFVFGFHEIEFRDSECRAIKEYKISPDIEVGIGYLSTEFSAKVHDIKRWEDKFHVTFIVNKQQKKFPIRIECFNFAITSKNEIKNLERIDYQSSSGYGDDIIEYKTIDEFIQKHKFDKEVNLVKFIYPISDYDNEIVEKVYIKLFDGKRCYIINDEIKLHKKTSLKTKIDEFLYL